MALALRYPKTVYPRMPKALPKIEYPLYALYFDGVDDYVRVPKKNLDITGDVLFTMFLHCSA